MFRILFWIIGIDREYLKLSNYGLAPKQSIICTSLKQQNILLVSFDGKTRLILSDKIRLIPTNIGVDLKLNSIVHLMHFSYDKHISDGIYDILMNDDAIILQGRSVKLIKSILKFKVWLRKLKKKLMGES